MRRILTSLTLLAVLWPAATQAQTACAQRDTVIKKLKASYGEAFAGGGMQNSKAIYEVWFSEEKGTWTILLTRANGMSCIMASGTNWLEAAPMVKEPEGVKS